MVALLLYAIAAVMLVVGISLWIQSQSIPLDPVAQKQSRDLASPPQAMPLGDPQSVSVIEQLERQFRNSPSHNPDA